VIVKSFSPIQPIARTRAELREELVRLWSEIFERELRADLEAEAEASGERARLRAIHSAPVRGIDGDAAGVDGGVPERGQP
jgi:hypothetical protein